MERRSFLKKAGVGLAAGAVAAPAIAVLIARGVSPEVALQTMSSDHSHDRRFMPNRLVLQIAGELLGYQTLPFDVAPYEHSVDGSQRSPWTPVEM